MAKTNKAKFAKVTSIKQFVQNQQDLSADFQDLQISGCSKTQSVKIALMMQDCIRAVAFRDSIKPVFYQRRALERLRIALDNLSILAMVFFLQGCVPFGLYQNAYNAGVDFFYPQPFTVSLQVKALPYAMQIVEHEGKSVVMVLAYSDSNRLAWVDAENNGFTTYYGKIISSNGLANDFETINPPNLSAVFNSLNFNYGHILEKQSLVRFLKPATSYLEAFHSFELKKSKPNSKLKRTLDGKEITYVMLEEKVQVPSISWSFSNFYWFDLNGKILKSKQYLTPDQPKYFLEILKDFNG